MAQLLLTIVCAQKKVLAGGGTGSKPEHRHRSQKTLNNNKKIEQKE
jgi:hypothetical protein